MRYYPSYLAYETEARLHVTPQITQAMAERGVTRCWLFPNPNFSYLGLWLGPFSPITWDPDEPGMVGTTGSSCFETGTVCKILCKDTGKSTELKCPQGMVTPVSAIVHPAGHLWPGAWAGSLAGSASASVHRESAVGNRILPH